MNGRWQLMKNTNSSTAGDRGFALVFVLLLLSMMSLMALAMVLSSSSDMLINGYYRNARGSFYAADSGLNIARQQLVNQILAQGPGAWSAPPIPNTATAAQTALTYITTTYANFTPLTGPNNGQALKSWSEQFEITSASFTPLGTPTVTSYCTTGASCTYVPSSYANYALCTSANTYITDVTGCSYTYQYSLTSVGAAQGSEQTSVSETGTVKVVFSAQPTTMTLNFASFGCWLDQYPLCDPDLGPLVPGVMTGPMFTNGAWQFMPGYYLFTDPVTQANADMGYWFGGTCIGSPTGSYKSGSQLIAPIFEGSPGFSLGLPAQSSPTDSFSQEWAVIDGKGCGEGSNICGNPSSPWPPVTSANLNADVRNAAGAAYPIGGASSGVYMNYTTNSGVNTMVGGGFYVEGSANIALSISGASAQVMAITQGSGSSATTTTITIDPLATPPPAWNCPAGTTGTTTLATQVGSGSPTTTNICSVPMNQVPSPPQPGTMVYVDGNINSLSGPGEGVPAIQDGSQLTITANGNIDITGDVRYNTEPVTTTNNQIVPGTNPACCNGQPVSTLIPGNDKNQVFGLFSANGNINLMSPYSDNMLQVDGALAPVQQGSQWCFTCTGFINTFNNVGAQVQSGICGCDMWYENTYFDRRFTSKPNFAPPWFPATTVTTGLTTNTPTPTVQRVQWVLNNM